MYVNIKFQVTLPYSSASKYPPAQKKKNHWQTKVQTPNKMKAAYRPLKLNSNILFEGLAVLSGTIKQLSNSSYCRLSSQKYTMAIHEADFN